MMGDTVHRPCLQHEPTKHNLPTPVLEPVRTAVTRTSRSSYAAQTCFLCRQALRGGRAAVGSCCLPRDGRRSPLEGRQRNRAPAGWFRYSSPGGSLRGSSPARIRLSTVCRCVPSPTGVRRLRS